MQAPAPDRVMEQAVVPVQAMVLGQETETEPSRLRLSARSELWSAPSDCHRIQEHKETVLLRITYLYAVSYARCTSPDWGALGVPKRLSRGSRASAVSCLLSF